MGANIDLHNRNILPIGAAAMLFRANRFSISVTRLAGARASDIVRKEAGAVGAKLIVIGTSERIQVSARLRLESRPA